MVASQQTIERIVAGHALVRMFSLLILCDVNVLTCVLIP